MYLQILQNMQIVKRYQDIILQIYQYKHTEIMRRTNLIFLLVVTLIWTIAKAATNWTEVEHKINEKIAEGHFTGCVLGIYTNNATLLKKAFGSMSPKYGLYSTPVTLDSIFDLNFITQVIGINAGMMQLYDLAKLNVTDKVYRYLSDFDNNGKRNLTISNLMIHNSGLQSTFTDAFGATPAQLLKKIYNLKLQYKQQTKFQYSELGFVVLGQLIAKVTNKTLDVALFEIMVEAGLRDVHFKPTTNLHLIAPSGYNNKGVVRGLPGNKIANFLGGVAGNAGLFSAIDSIAYYMQLLLNKGKMPLGSRIFSENVTNLFTTKVATKNYNNTRALGWDTVPLIDPPCGKKFSEHSFGFSDPFGSYLWADKDKNISIILLAAGGFPTPNNLNHAKAQGEISDAIMTALGH